jgi:hypothetical protein
MIGGGVAAIVNVCAVLIIVVPAKVGLHLAPRRAPELIR